MEGPPLGRQQLFLPHQNWLLLQLLPGDEGCEGGGVGLLGTHLSSSSSQVHPPGHEGVGGEGEWGAQQPLPELHGQPLEGHWVPDGGEGGGVEGPPLGKQHDFLPHQN